MKKWLLFSLVFIIVASGASAGCSSGKTEGGKSIGVIQVPGGSKIKVVYAEDFPKELEVNWGKIGMADAFQLGLEGTVRNVGNQTVSFRIAFVLDGDQIGVWPPPFRGVKPTLMPGEETRRFNMGMVGYSENSKILEVKVKEFEIIGDSVITTSESTTPEPTPRADMTPEEVAITFYFLLNEGKYQEAEKLLSLGGKDFSKLFPEIALESFNEEFFQSRRMNNIDVGKIEYDEEASEAIIHYIKFYFEGGSYVVFDDGIELVLENGVWEMDEYCY